MAHSHAISGIVLAGGSAQRMGGDEKALLEVGGRAMILRVVDRLRPVCGEILVVTLRPSVLAPHLEGVGLVEDLQRGVGPLGGIHAGLAACEFSHAFVVACDMPFLMPEVVERLAQEINGGDVVLPRIAQRDQPLHAFYSKAVTGTAGAVLRDGGRSLRELFAECHIHHFPESRLRDIDGYQRSFFNVNTPEDLETARQWAAAGEGSLPPRGTESAAPPQSAV